MRPEDFDVNLADIEAAQEKIMNMGVRRTPLYRSDRISDLLRCEVAIKYESLQLGGSFKIRGVLNKLLHLSVEERARGVVTVSGGNHAIATALAGRLLQVPVTVMMSESTPKMNIDATRAEGATVVLKEDVGSAFSAAMAEAQNGRVFVHPYDDPQIIAGHGTVGLEIVQDYEPSHLFISIGGGGFMAGVATAVKAYRPEAKIVGAETIGADAMSRAMAAGSPVRIAPTSKVSTLSAPFASERTLAAAMLFLEGIELVDDTAAYEGARRLLSTERTLCEPAAGSALAGAINNAGSLTRDSQVCIVVCGSNIDSRELVCS